MIPKDCKRFAEVSRHAARGKSIRHGHPIARALKAATP
jgi:hypothetical protein